MGTTDPKTYHNFSVFYINLSCITVFTQSHKFVHILSLLNPLQSFMLYLYDTHSKSLSSSYL